MNHDDEHKRDHDRIIGMLDCTRQVAEHEIQLALVKERINEMKEDKDKTSAWNMRLVGILATIIMVTLGSAFTSYSTINVLKEKVSEQKDEINKLNVYIQDVEANLEFNLDGHEH